ncbi:hypothetical protein AAFF_G00268930 [Aldrovandia affinis]|uniref:Uncharacterized protein n=1 Tax=Aldrovandia affinis TaxID=143900 RepID=A0AAD7WTM2_9TELE|nr:hypothetical protein AAFF_G00268930 [Aldrovandia affinis]
MKDEERTICPADAPATAPPSALSTANPQPVITRTSQTLHELIDEATFHDDVAGKQTPALSLQATCGGIITGATMTQRPPLATEYGTPLLSPVTR